jgi:hypothetical protein
MHFPDQEVDNNQSEFPSHIPNVILFVIHLIFFHALHICSAGPIRLTPLH